MESGAQYDERRRILIDASVRSVISSDSVGARFMLDSYRVVWLDIHRSNQSEAGGPERQPRKLAKAAVKSNNLYFKRR